MRYTKDWKDYELIDCSDGEKLERWGEIILVKPDPQVIWKTPKTNPLWKKASAYYVDEGLAAKCNSIFERPDETEIDVRIVG